jgi:CubicO group peptidase (beta-lactamase class C family)
LRLAALTLALGLGAGGAAAQEPDSLPPARRDAVQAAIARVVAQQAIPGLAAAVATEHRLRWTGAFGSADLENAVPVRPETAFRIASITKAITATAVLQLVEQGRMDLDAPIRHYVPAFPEKPCPSSLRQLLCHQGGIRHLRVEEWHSTRHYASVVDALDAFKDDPLVYSPSTRALYSTYGYCLLGAAVETASGLGFADYLRRHVFEPAGMETTRPDDVFELIPHRAQGYVRGPSGGLLNSVLADTSNKLPGGGLVSTAADVARFGAALEAGLLLRPETLARMLVRQKTRDGKSTDYGLGWLVGQRRGRREAWHHGGQPCVSTMLYLLPDQGVAVALLCNLEGVSTPLLELARQVADTVR